MARKVLETTKKPYHARRGMFTVNVHPGVYVRIVMKLTLYVTRQCRAEPLRPLINTLTMPQPPRPRHQYTPGYRR